MAYEIKILSQDRKEQTIALTTNSIVVGDDENADFRLRLSKETFFFIRINKNVKLNKFVVLFNGEINVYLDQNAIEPNESYIWEFDAKLRIENEFCLFLQEIGDDQVFYAGGEPSSRSSISASNRPESSLRRLSQNYQQSPIRKKLTDLPGRNSRLLDRSNENDNPPRLLNRGSNQGATGLDSAVRVPIPQNGETIAVPPVQELESFDLSLKKTTDFSEDVPQQAESKSTSPQKTSPVIIVGFFVAIIFGGGTLFYSNFSSTEGNDSFDELAKAVYAELQNEESQESDLAEIASHFFAARFYETQNLGDTKRDATAQAEYYIVVQKVDENGSPFKKRLADYANVRFARLKPKKTDSKK